MSRAMVSEMENETTLKRLHKTAVVLNNPGDGGTIWHYVERRSIMKSEVVDAGEMWSGRRSRKPGTWCLA